MEEVLGKSRITSSTSIVAETEFNGTKNKSSTDPSINSRYDDDISEFANVYKNAVTIRSLRSSVTENETLSRFPRKLSRKLENKLTSDAKPIGRMSVIERKSLLGRKPSIGRKSLVEKEESLKEIHEVVEPRQILSTVLDSSRIKQQVSGFQIINIASKNVSQENSSKYPKTTDSIDVDIKRSLDELTEIVENEIKEREKTEDSIDEDFNEIFGQQIPSKESKILMDELSEDSDILNPSSSEKVKASISFETADAKQKFNGAFETYLNCSSDDIEDSGISSSNMDDYEDREGFTYKYEGEYDANRLRTNFGCLKWRGEESRKYCGCFQYNTLHGDGYYLMKREGCFSFYSGKFYNNQLQGYGQIIFNNGDKFEGLFRENTRFGPGVMFNGHGTEDVGIWYGNSLLRLSTNVSDSITQLGKTTIGKLKLLEYKKIVPVRSTSDERAKSVLEELSADESVSKRFKELYNPHVRNSNSLFFDRSQYDLAYSGQEDCGIEVLDNNLFLPDFVLLKSETSCQRLKDENLMEADHLENTRKQLILLKRKIENMKSQCENKKSELQSDNNETEMKSLLQEETFLNNVLDFISFKLTKCTEKGGVCATKKVEVDSILAWNNDDTLVDILRHSFFSRKSEENVVFDVRNVVIGKRNNFGPAGQHERCCVQFLEACSAEDVLGALQLMVHEKINPNVSDSKGNTALHLATWHQAIGIIRMLANHGSNLDCVNDEGISPINLCLLRYLETVHDVFSWEASFLYLFGYTTDKKNLALWRPHESFVDLIRAKASKQSQLTVNQSGKSLRSTSRKRISSKKSSRLSQLYLDRFLFALNPSSRKSTYFKSNLEPVKVSSSLMKKGRSEVIKKSPEETTKLLRTLETLLHYGADPNKEAAPYPPLFLALFSKSPEIVGSLLKKKANPDANLNGMTALQVVSCMDPSEENCRLMQLLLDHSADPNILSDPSIWSDCDKFLLGDFETSCEVQMRGKDALHFICLKDYLATTNNQLLLEMVGMLMSAKINTRRLYLGHSHLSMAVLKGNMALVEGLSNFENPARTLGFGLGNALTLLALSRYPNILPFSDCQQILDYLMFTRVSPFDPVYDYNNIFEFLEEDSPSELGDNPKVWEKYSAYVKSIRNYLKTDLVHETGRRSNELSKIYLQEKSRKILDVVNKFKAVFYLYCFIREQTSNQYTLHLAKFLTNSEEALKYIRYIFNSGKMPRSYFSLLLIAELMMYVDNVNNIKKTIEIKPEEMSLFSYVSHKSKIEPDALSTTSRRTKPDEISLASFKSQHGGKPNRRDYNLKDYLQQLDESSFDECSEASSEYVDRWVTEESLRKCNVCYFCMQRKDKTLLRCPQCGVVKFCSRRCNYLSLKLKNFHPCPGVFYQDVHKDVKVFIENNLPLPVYGIDLAFETLRNKRLNKANRMMSEDSSVKSHRSLRIRLRGGNNATQENQYVSRETTSRVENKICINKPNISDDNTMIKDVKNKNYKSSLNDEIYKHLWMDRISSISNNSMKNMKDSMELKLNVASECDALVRDRISDLSVLPQLKIKNKKYINSCIEGKTEMKRITSKNFNFPPILEDNCELIGKIDKGTPYKHEKQGINIKDKQFSTDEIVKEKHNSGNTDNKRIALQAFRYFFRDVQDLDVKSLFLPFTCYSEGRIFHRLSSDSSYFYQSFEIPSNE